MKQAIQRNQKYTASFFYVLKDKKSINSVISANTFNVCILLWNSIPGHKTHGSLYFRSQNAHHRTQVKFLMHWKAYRAQIL